MPSSRVYRFGGFTLDPAAMSLCRAEQELALEPKSFRLLQYLIENRDRILSKEEIFRVVWQETAVTDNALTRAVAQIRKVLEDDPRNPRYIDTVPTVGYRFIGTLTENEPAPPLRKRPSKTVFWISIGAAVLVVAGLTAWQLRSKPPRSTISAPIPLTAYRGSANWPSFSPDGSQVAFQWDGEKQDNIDIYVKGLGADAAPLRLTTDAAADQWPAWSPDGATIAFVRVIAPDKAHLMLIPALGGPERKLADLTIWLDHPSYVPAWSADSKWLIVPSVPSGDTEHAALFRVSVETGESTQITYPDPSVEDYLPAISPDGSTLLFVRRPSYSLGALYQTRIDGNANPIESPRHISTGGTPLRRAAWTADGKEIVAGTPNGAIRVPAGGSDRPAQLPLLNVNMCCFDLSRRGDRMVYAVIHGDANLWRIDLTAKAPQPERLIASIARDVYPQYSPDGQRLAFYSTRSGGSGQIWVGDPEGRLPRQLTFVKKQAATPHWSPDGRTLVFDSRESTVQLYTISSDGGKMTQLISDQFDNFNATWSRDGRWMYFTSTRTGREEIWKMPAGGGPPFQVTHNGGVKGIESEDGKTLYFGNDRGSGSVRKMPVAGGPEQQLTDSLYRDNFAVTKKGIFYMTNPSNLGTSTLKFYSFATGATAIILQMGIPEYGLDVSPDGRYLVYAQLDDPASELMLVENFN